MREGWEYARTASGPYHARQGFTDYARRRRYLKKLVPAEGVERIAPIFKFEYGMVKIRVWKFVFYLFHEVQGQKPVS